MLNADEVRALYLLFGNGKMQGAVVGVCLFTVVDWTMRYRRSTFLCYRPAINLNDELRLIFPCLVYGTVLGGWWKRYITCGTWVAVNQARNS